MYLTDPFNDGFTVTDSPGISPDSMLRFPRAERTMLIQLDLQYTAKVGNCHLFLLGKMKKPDGICRRAGENGLPRLLTEPRNDRGWDHSRFLRISLGLILPIRRTSSTRIRKYTAMTPANSAP